MAQGTPTNDLHHQVGSNGIHTLQRRYTKRKACKYRCRDPEDESWQASLQKSLVPPPPQSYASPQTPSITWFVCAMPLTCGMNMAKPSLRLVMLMSQPLLPSKIVTLSHKLIP